MELRGHDVRDLTHPGEADRGGKAPCFAHLLDDEHDVDDADDADGIEYLTIHRRRDGLTIR